MITSAAIITVLGALVPAVVGQNNPVGENNYLVEANPDLTPQTLATITLSKPNCANGILSRNPICDKSLSANDRAQGLVSSLTLEELINISGNTAFGVPRIGLPPYQVWNEALHGLDRANFSLSGDFSWGTSFPQPILTMAGLNRTMVNFIGQQISTQARAFNNFGKYGLDAYAPNINGFRSPIWGRGQETPGEDAFFLTSAYAFEYISGMQGGANPDIVKIATTPKHFYGYDLENFDNMSRLGLDVLITPQDLAGYYTPQFKTAVRDAKARSLMCSYNAVNGVPSCANSFGLQTLLRNEWGFDKHFGYVSTDCDAAYNVFNPHMYAKNESSAAADSIRAGADIDCGTTYQFHLNESVLSGEISRTEIETAVARLYTQLVMTGEFDGTTPWSNLTWDDVVEQNAWNTSYEAAVEGIVLLMNDGTLPLSNQTKSVALIGPWANATVDMQGNYFGTPPFLVSPLQAFTESGLTVNYEFGTQINTLSTANFSKAMAAASMSDVIIFAGGIDGSIEAEAFDRDNVTWPGNQVDLITQLSTLGKPVIVLQMGGGQVDQTRVKNNTNVNALVWGGYPGQSGGYAIRDILLGKRAPAGRLVTTSYPEAYVNEFPQQELGLRPNASSGNPGQTYIWYSGQPVFEFGTGLFYTTFNETASATQNATVTANISDVITAPHPATEFVEQATLTNFSVDVSNTGRVASDYTAMLFVSTQDAGPAPFPNKWLVGFDRLKSIAPGQSSTMTIPVPVGAVARTDSQGNSVLFPGTYELALNNERSVVVTVTLTGQAHTLTKWPLEEQQIPQA